MVNSMSVRCPQCFSENAEQYRFCGMCGTPLPRLGAASEEDDARVERAAPPVAMPGKERTTVPVTGPSFLGLSQDQNPYPDRSLDYLLEDEPDPGRKRMYLAVLLVVAAVAMLAWRWRHSGFFARTRPAVVATPSDATMNSPDSSLPSPSASPSAVPSKSSDSAAGSPTDSGSGATDHAGAPVHDETAKPAASEQTQAAVPTTSNPIPNDSGNSVTKPEAPSTTAREPTAEKAVATPPPVAEAVRRVSREAKAPSPPPASQPDLLVAEGEKYLYGNGVPQNCARAEKSLLSAAQRASSKAESILGTMYATGHCVGRDLPTAYRWFAKASHQDSNNARITRDLEVLWKQMTPGERQLAVNSRE